MEKYIQEFFNYCNTNIEPTNNYTIRYYSNYFYDNNYILIHFTDNKSKDDFNNIHEIEWKDSITNNKITFVNIKFYNNICLRYKSGHHNEYRVHYFYQFGNHNNNNNEIEIINKECPLTLSLNFETDIKIITDLIDCVECPKIILK
jgi:hypothetical protein